MALLACPSFRGVPPPPLPPPTPLLLLLTSLVLRVSGLLLLFVGSAAAARANVAGVVAVAAGVVVGAAVEVVEVAEVVAAVGVVAGVGALVAVVVEAVGVAVVATVGVVVVGVELFRRKVLAVARGCSSSVGARPLRPSSFTCGKFHTQHRCFSLLDDAWHAEFGDEAEHPRWAELLRYGVDIFALDYDAILAAMYALSFSAEGDCYWCVLPDPGIEAAALGASESSLPSTVPAEALHTFTLDSGASRCFLCDSTALTPLLAPVPVRLADPSRSPVLARSSTILSCSAVPCGSLSGLHLPSFSTNLVSTAALQDAIVSTTTGGGQRVSICTCTQMGRHLATFTRRPRSSLYTVCTAPPHVAASAYVSASGQVAPPCSCRLLSHQTLLWHHCLGHPSLPCLRGMHSSLLDVTFDESVPFYRLFTYHSAPLPPPLLFPAPGPPPVDPLPPQGPAPSVVSQPASAEPRGAAPAGAEREGAEPGGAEPRGVELESAEPGGPEPKVAEPGGAESEGVGPGGAEPRGTASFGGPAGASPRQSPRPEPLSLQQLHKWFPQRTRLWSGAAGAGDSTAGGTGAGGDGATSFGGAGVPTGPGGNGGAAAAGPGGARARGTGAAGAGGVVGTGAGGSGAQDPGTGGAGAGGIGAGGAGAREAGAGDLGAGGDGAGGTGPGGTGAGGAGAGGAGAGDPGARGVEAGGTGAGGAGAAGTGAVDPGAGGAGTGDALSGSTRAGGTVQRCPFFVPPPPSSLPPPDSVPCQVLSLPSSLGLPPSLLSPPPCKSQPKLRPDSPLPAPSPYTEQTDSFTERRQPKSRPASPVSAVRIGCRVPCPRPPLVPGTHVMTLRPSSVPLRVPLQPPPESSRPDLKSDLARAASPTISCLLATVVTDPSFESSAASALVVELVDFAAACRLDYATSLVAKAESDCPPSVGGESALGMDVLEDRQEDFKCLVAAVPHLVTAMDAKMASWKSTGTYLNAVPPSGANIVDGMWIFRVKQPPGSPPVFKARYVARGVLLHVADQRDYELHSLDLSTDFLQGSLHEEIWLRRSPGFTGSFRAGTQWSLRRPVYGLRQAPREWHDTLRTTLAALGFAPSTADPLLFLRTDTSLPSFYVLVYVDDLVFATADTDALAVVKSELQKRHTCTDLGEPRSYLDLKITRDRARRTITFTQSHMVHQVLQRFGFRYSSPQSTPLPTGHSLSAPPSDESVEPSGPYPELVGYLITSGMGLVLRGRGPVVLTGHVDASWVDDLATVVTGLHLQP
ncbi:unnamed protein product [Closterium sp. NIES-54]